MSYLFSITIKDIEETNGDAMGFIMWFGQCYELNCTYLSLNPYVKTLALILTVFGDRAYRRQLRLNVRS